MQTQDSPAEFLFKIWPWMEANKNRIIGAVVAVVVFCFILYFMSAQKAQREIEAGQAVTAVIMNPDAANSDAQLATQYQQLAQKYSGTAAGRRAQLQAAASLFDAGNYADAETGFQNFLNGTSTGPLAATAQLGIGACEEAQNKPDAAAAAYQRVVSLFADSTCVASAQLALGRIAESQNKLTEAMSHYETAAGSGTGGSIAQEAMIRAADLKAKLAATAPKPPAGATAKPAGAPSFAPLSVPQN